MGRRAGLRGRTYTYATLMGSVVATLLVGLLVPFVFGSPPAARPDVRNDPRPLPSMAGGVPGSEPEPGQTAGATDSEPDATPSGDAPAATPAPGAAGTSPTPDGQPSPAASSEPPAQRTASDEGVTPETVEVAFFTANFSQLARAGYGLDLGDEEGVYQGYIDQVNAAGGIHGRTIDPVFIPFDPADADDRRRACLEATEDHEVFATVNLVGMFGAGALCVAEEHETPLLAYLGESDSLHARSAGRYTSFQMSKNTSLAS
ncbi:MAG TPA: hypothetical protein VGA36_11720, partial [Nitriliruptorales bacterium]